ncbi:hypothetical protein phiMa_07 [Thermus phage phiMa]|nr:hypothetical protein phiMa_07 [Thermus phage phiMa]
MRAEELAHEDLVALERAQREAEALMARLQGLGYEVHLGRNTVLERWEAVVFSHEGRMVGYGWGQTRLEALHSLVADLGHAGGE